jgi:hypothetical protein
MRGDVALSIELLTGARAWADAARVSREVLDKIPDTVRDNPRRQRMNLLRIASDYELAVKEGKLEKLASLQSQWIATQEAIKQEEKEDERRRSSFFGFQIPN